MKILLGVDFSGDAKAAVRFVSGIHFPTGSKYLLLHVITGRKGLEGLGHSLDLEEGLRTIQKKVLEKAKVNLRRLGEKAFDSRLTLQCMAKEGNPGQEILTILEKEHIDLAILGTRGLSGVQRFLLGSVSEWILNEAPCPVLVVRGQTRRVGGKSPRGMRVVMAIDGSLDAQAALDFLNTLTFPPDSRIILFHVVEPKDYTIVQDDYKMYRLSDGEQLDLRELEKENRNRITHARGSLLKEARRGMKGKDIKVEEVSVGFAAEEIIKAAYRFRADLMVVGSRGLSGIKRVFMGSVSNRVAQYAPCSVLVVRRPQKTKRMKS